LYRVNLQFDVSLIFPDLLLISKLFKQFHQLNWEVGKNGVILFRGYLGKRL